MLVEYHQRVPSLQRYSLQHEDMVGHQVSLDDLYPLVLTELPEDLPKVALNFSYSTWAAVLGFMPRKIIPSIATIFCCIIFFLGTILVATD